MSLYNSHISSAQKSSLLPPTHFHFHGWFCGIERKEHFLPVSVLPAFCKTLSDLFQRSTARKERQRGSGERRVDFPLRGHNFSVRK